MGASGFGRSVTWPTPTSTGVRGSRVTAAERSFLVFAGISGVGAGGVGDPTPPHSGPGDPKGAPRAPQGPRYASTMRIAVGSDHAGYLLKEFLSAHLAELGHDVDDLGTHSEQRVDYPRFGAAVGQAVTEGRAELGVCACGTGIGISIAANKVQGVRAAGRPRRHHGAPGPGPQSCQRGVHGWPERRERGRQRRHRHVLVDRTHRGLAMITVSRRSRPLRCGPLIARAARVAGDRHG